MKTVQPDTSIIASNMEHQTHVQGGGNAARSFLPEPKVTSEFEYGVATIKYRSGSAIGLRVNQVNTASGSGIAPMLSPNEIFRMLMNLNQSLIILLVD